MTVIALDTYHWHEHAACRGEMGRDFYPPLHHEPRPDRRAREARAKAVCAGCPVRRECLREALVNDERYGVWGGLTDAERRTRCA